MQKIFKQQRKSHRLQDFDYSLSGYYFVTICTKNKMNIFGNIHDSKMILNNIGRIVLKIWQSIPEHYSNVLLDEYVIMPNHIHGIIIIQENISYKDVGTGHCPVHGLCNMPALRWTGQCPVPTRKTYGLLSKIINSFKNAVSKELRRQNITSSFAWQRSFHDHVIRSEKGLQQIRSYINNNPLKWFLDKYYKY